jgi:putative tricarboxylic transport membrane protein
LIAVVGRRASIQSVEGTSVLAPGSNSSGRKFTFRIRAPQDFYGGLALIALAIFAIWAGSDLPGQHGFSFGPGTAPRMFAGLLALVGGLISFGGLMADGPAIGRFAFRGPAIIAAAILFFALAIRPLGLVVASYVTFMISILASDEMRWFESLIAAAVMTLFCVGLFVYLLQLPFQLWPEYFI